MTNFLTISNTKRSFYSSPTTAIRRVPVDMLRNDDSKGLSFQKLLVLAVQFSPSFPDLLLASDRITWNNSDEIKRVLVQRYWTDCRAWYLEFTYQDEDGDQVSFSTDQELLRTIQELCSTGKSTFRCNVTLKPQQKGLEAYLNVETAFAAPATIDRLSNKRALPIVTSSVPVKNARRTRVNITPDDRLENTREMPKDNQQNPLDLSASENLIDTNSFLLEGMSLAIRQAISLSGLQPKNIADINLDGLKILMRQAKYPQVSKHMHVINFDDGSHEWSLLPADFTFGVRNTREIFTMWMCPDEEQRVLPLRFLKARFFRYVAEIRRNDGKPRGKSSDTFNMVKRYQELRPYMGLFERALRERGMWKPYPTPDEVSDWYDAVFPSIHVEEEDNNNDNDDNDVENVDNDKPKQRKNFDQFRWTTAITYLSEIYRSKGLGSWRSDVRNYFKQLKEGKLDDNDASQHTKLCHEPRSAILL